MKRQLWMVAAVALGALPSVAFGQLSVMRQWYAPAMYNLGGSDMNYLEIVGTEDVGGAITDLFANVSVYRYVDPADFSVRMYVEYKTYRNSVLQRRVVADGLHVWSYDALKNQYSSWTYDRESSDKNRDWAAAAVNVLRTIRRQAQGIDDIMFGTLLDANEARTGVARLLIQWTPWMPSATINGSGPTFTASTTTPKATSMDYNISQPVPGDYHFLGIDNGKMWVPSGKTTAYTQFSMTVDENSYPASASFTFNPGNAKPVSVGIPQTAGG